MTIRDGVTQVSGLDKRLVDSCLRVMKQRGYDVPLSVDSGQLGANQINETFRSQDWSNEDKDRTVKVILNEAKQALIPLGELDWFMKDERACYFVWATISKSVFFAAPSQPVVQVAPGQQHPLALGYNQLGLKPAPSSTQERFDEVVKFLDRVSQPLIWQNQLVSTLKCQWGALFTNRRPFAWLKANDEDQLRWAWEYINKPSSNASKPPIFSFTPTGSKELYLTIYAAFDSWLVSPDSKRLFLNDFNKAWNQKKHRDGLQGKKACNFTLDIEVKHQLDELAENNGMKKNEYIESLIRREYSKINE